MPVITRPSAKNIETPLLSWAGKADGSVDFRQSVELHLAMRRLGKPNIMLLYPGKGHILNKYEAKIHLTQKVKEWFDYFLKDNHNYDWIQKEMGSCTN